MQKPNPFGEEYEDEESDREYDERPQYAVNPGNAFRTADTKTKVLGIVLLVWLLGCLVGILVCMTMRVMVACIVFFCLFVGTILIAMITVTVKQKLSMHGKNFADEKKQGVVLACTVSSTTTVNRRVTSTVYRLQIDVDGQTRTAYTRKYYTVGDKITVRLHKNPKNTSACVVPDFDAEQALQEREATLDRLYEERTAPIVREEDTKDENDALAAVQACHDAQTASDGQEPEEQNDAPDGAPKADTARPSRAPRKLK